MSARVASSPSPSPARPALATVPRGARTICEHRNGYLVGGTLSRGGNQLVYISRSVPSTLSCSKTWNFDGEFWGLSSLENDDLILSIRRGASSLCAIASLSYEKSSSIISLRHTLPLPSTALGCTVNASCAQALFFTPSFAYASDISLAVLRALPLRIGASEGEIVCGGAELDGSSVFVADRGGVQVHDLRSSDAKCGVNLSVEGAGIRTFGPWKLATRRGRLSAACMHAGMVGTGMEDGRLCIWDTRKATEVLAENVERLTHWVTAMESAPSGFLSASADGLVRCWDSNLEKCAVFPHHADAVYGMHSSHKGFVSVSYEGRVAFNSYPEFCRADNP